MIAACDAQTPSGVTSTAEVAPPVATASPATLAQKATVASQLATPAADRIRVEVTRGTGTYQVFGATPDEIFTYMEAYGPVDERGGRASGVTHYKSRLDWRTNGDSRSCTIATMTIYVELDVLLPALDGLARLTRDLQRSWNEFAQGVAAHEQRHVDIYLEGANTLKSRMQALQPVAGCSVLEAQVNEVWGTEQKQTDAAQELFHEDERRRVESLRAPLRSQIDANRARDSALTSEVVSLDAGLATLDGQVGSLRTLLDSLKAQMAAVESRYQGQAVPDGVYQQYESWRIQYNGLIPGYNALIDSYNREVARRAGLAAEIETLRLRTNDLVDEYNWTR